MSIWGRRDSEPPPGDANESQSPAQAQALTEPEPGSQAEPQAQAEPLAQADGQADEPAPAFWRAQGETPAPAGGQAALAPGDMAVLDRRAEPAGEAQEPAAPEPAVPQAAVPKSAVPEPAAPEPAVPEPAAPQAAAPAAADAPAADAPGSLAGISAQRWSEILATFVDDPRGSVKMAADAVAEAVDEFVASVRARQRALESSWHGTETDTEQLRTALRDYRRFWHQVQQLDPAGKTGG